ncbi:MAG: hypothetical protein K2X34_06960, partial [Hyphomonadaceae bacterium]|nr:hypothetical protein [Hyphomonadaceae bacterium]
LELMPRDRPVLFETPGNFERVIALTGFDGRDAHGVWTSQRIASLRMHLGALDGELRFELDYSVFLPQPGLEFELTALVNGTPLDTWVEHGWSGWRRKQRTLTAPRADCQAMATWLTFRCKLRADEIPAQPPSFALHAIEAREPRL